MRKLIALVLAFVLAGSIAFGESRFSDLSALSFDELLELRGMVDEELINRSSNADGIIHTGNYVVGTDIFAGQYDFLVVWTSYTGFIARLDENGKTIDTSFADLGKVIHMNLVNGETLQMYNCSAIVQIPKKPSWMP